ncbi:hypothetical protein ACJMK2_019328 [Sinanodonta woodiana]|uniref:THD domain-containing protein n=1 Tax=Sinanodonta woodiana TaxID=1069815 RepID=A0ABD3UHM9_SINWO
MASVDGILLETGCRCCCKKNDSSLMQMRRFVIFMTCACAFACFITLMLTVCTAYIYIHQAEKPGCKVDQQTGSNIGVGESQTVSMDTYFSESKVNQRIARAVNVKPRHKGHNKKDNKCGKKCPAERKMEHSNLRPLHNATSESLNINDYSRKADHYVANFKEQIFPLFDHRISDSSTDCQQIREWGGQLCRNRIFFSENTPLTLNVFKRARWMEKFQESDTILTKMENGVFAAKKTGLYLLYAQLLFHDLQPMEVFKMVHRHNGEDMHSLKCMDGTDYIDSSLTGMGNFRHKTCAIMGVLLLNNTDTIEVVMATPTRIDLSESATYFGAVLLS